MGFRVLTIAKAIKIDSLSITLKPHELGIPGTQARVGITDSY
jgi:hypothetical protein